jgi:glutathione peroxidase
MNKKLKRLIVVILLLIGFFSVYVEITNRNSRDMTYRQKVLKAIYPAWMWWAKLTGTNNKKISNPNSVPAVSFYSLTDSLINGTVFNFENLKGKKVLLVNTASDCGYTNQYNDLEKLQQQYKETLFILGFPSNDFKQQEKGDNKSIEKFCKENYGVSFLMMAKSNVKSGPDQNMVFRWLTDSTKNGWNSQEPSWNFSKYLVDETGRLTDFFGSTIKPFSKAITGAIENK